MIRGTGRYFCDFLQSVDNIHFQMHFSYRKMKSPSMQISEIDEKGGILTYRSCRLGYAQYLIGTLLNAKKFLKLESFFYLIFFLSLSGQLLEIAETMFGLSLEIKILDLKTVQTKGPKSKTELIPSLIVKYRLDFDNSEYVRI